MGHALKRSDASATPSIIVVDQQYQKFADPSTTPQNIVDHGQLTKFSWGIWTTSSNIGND